MNLTHHIAVINDRLLREIGQSHLSLETVFLLYGAIVLVAAVLWAIGAAVFGRKGSTPKPDARSAHSRDRATPVAP